MKNEILLVHLDCNITVNDDSENFPKWKLFRYSLKTFLKSDSNLFVRIILFRMEKIDHFSLLNVKKLP